MTATTQNDATAIAQALAKALARLAEFTAELSENFHKDLGLEVPKTATVLGKRKKPAVDPRAPKKPKTAYMLFNEWAREQAKAKGEAAPAMTKLGEEWQAMSEKEKAKFVEEAEKAKEAYAKEVEKYKSEHVGNEDEDEGSDVPPPGAH